MVELPPVAPAVGWRTTTRLPRDHYVRVASNDYSVHPSSIGRMVEVRADLEHVLVSCADTRLAEHKRCWAAHQTITDPAHAEAAARLRRAHLKTAPAADIEVERRQLNVYDALLAQDPVEGVA